MEPGPLCCDAAHVSPKARSRRPLERRFLATRDGGRWSRMRVARSSARPCPRSPGGTIAFLFARLKSVTQKKHRLPGPWWGLLFGRGPQTKGCHFAVHISHHPDMEMIAAGGVNYTVPCGGEPVTHQRWPHPKRSRLPNIGHMPTTRTWKLMAYVGWLGLRCGKQRCGRCAHDCADGQGRQMQKPPSCQGSCAFLGPQFSYKSKELVSNETHWIIESSSP